MELSARHPCHAPGLEHHEESDEPGFVEARTNRWYQLPARGQFEQVSLSRSRARTFRPWQNRFHHTPPDQWSAGTQHGRHQGRTRVGVDAAAECGSNCSRPVSKFRAERNVYLAFSPDESLMGFGSPKRNATSAGNRTGACCLQPQAFSTTGWNSGWDSSTRSNFRRLCWAPDRSSCPTVSLLLTVFPISNSSRPFRRRM